MRLPALRALYGGIPLQRSCYQKDNSIQGNSHMAKDKRRRRHNLTPPSNKHRYGLYDAARTDELHIHFSGSDMLKDRYQPSLYIVTAHFTAALLNNSLPCKHFTAYIRAKKGCVLVISSGYTVNTELRRANAASNLRR